MPIPAVDRETILDALGRFDDELRTGEFLTWDQNRAQQWAIEHEGKLYPPKKVISMAAGIPVDAFTGGPESNNYLEARGFTVRPLRESSLQDALAEILTAYPHLRDSEQFGGNKKARALFKRATDVLLIWVRQTNNPSLQVVASYGKGNWATIPWIAVLDSRATTSTQRGIYVVYLFSEGGDAVTLTLNQGVTEVEKAHGARAPDELRSRAIEVRAKLDGLAEKGWDMSGQSSLNSTARLARLYASSTIAAKLYRSDAIPTDSELRDDLFSVLDGYKRIVDEQAQQQGSFVDDRRLSLIGTWRTIDQDLAGVRDAIDKKGGWASWWSFPIKEGAQARLTPPFNLYAYEGDRRILARLRVDDLRTSNGSAGLETPWPELTDPGLQNKTRAGDRLSEVFKTWFRIGAIERLASPRSTDDFEVAIGLSTADSLLNQNTFGYVIEDEPIDAERDRTPTALGLSLPQRGDLAALAERSGLRLELLREMQDALLGQLPQILLAGPPGTSKTWIARELAMHLTANQAPLVRFVQFHPGYSYESFVEGLRPVTTAHGVSFGRQDGLVVETVREMREKKLADRNDVDFVIIMDEVNRANLPRVLGELMFAFEYRDHSVRLQYSQEFALPKNLRFIGTMNTADRSIRSIDIALRRRFEVFELQPDAAILERFHAKQGRAADRTLIDGFIKLNRMLETHLDRHHTIGHAFFMHPEWTDRRLRSVWQRRVYPLIEEFFFDQPELLKEFTIEQFWPR